MITDVSVQTLMARLSSARAPLVFDVRRWAAFAASPRVLPGAAWRHPDTVETWAEELAPASEVVVYCVHGHEVSRGVAARLAALGHRAAVLEGGIERWKEAGGPTSPTVLSGGSCGRLRCAG